MKFLIWLSLLNYMGTYWGEDNQSFTLKDNKEILIDIDGCGFKGRYELAVKKDKLKLETFDLKPIYGDECFSVDWNPSLTGTIEENCFMFNEIGFYCRETN